MKRTATAPYLLAKRKKNSENPLGRRNSILFLKRKEINSKPKRIKHLALQNQHPKKQKNQSLHLNQ